MKKIRLFTLSIVALAGAALTLMTSCATQPKWNTAEGEVMKDLAYGEGSRNRYDLYLPACEKPKALMLFIHGGSWISGEKEDMAWAAERYAKEGYITASINYTRLGGDELGYETPYERACMPTMLDEINSSIIAIKAQCKALGYSIREMAIGGYSAGAHLTMLYSTLYATKSPIPIKFQISWVGPSDFNLLFPTPPNFDLVGSLPENDSRVFYANMNNFLYGISGERPTPETTAEQIHDLKSKVSPCDLVTAQTPPAVLAYGGKDHLVNAIHGEKMVQALDAVGVESSYTFFPNSGHGLESDPDSSAKLQEAILQFCEKYFVGK
ncbi:MAG: alpha/beta hydrolase [Alistipes sp.]|nr:alpha/beta hydrolase [Alistipes sp.]